MKSMLSRIFLVAALGSTLVICDCRSDEGDANSLRVASPTTLHVTPGILSLIAGNIDGPGSADNIGHSAQFGEAISDIGENPKGVAIDASGNLYVADVSNHTIRKITPAGVVTTIAGKAGVPGNADGVASIARFNYPTGLAIDSRGNLYVTDSANCTIRKITPEGDVSTLAGKAGERGNADGKGSAARFRHPQGIAVNKDGIIYVADTFNNAVRILSSDGNVTTVRGMNPPGMFSTEPETLFWHPTDIMVDLSGEVYVADKGHRAIRIVRTEGVATIFASTKGDVDGRFSEAHISSPTGLGSDKSGIYVTSGHEIRKIDRHGEVSTLAGQREVSGYADGIGTKALFSSPGSPVADKEGNLFLADGSVIRKISSIGQVTTFAGQMRIAGNSDATGGNAQFNNPIYLALDTSGNLLVTDRGNSTIRKINKDGAVTTFAGRGGLGGTGYLDGASGLAKFAAPAGIAADSFGNVFVSDMQNRVIRKISSSGEVTTLAGAAGEKGSVDGVGAKARFNFPLDIVCDKSGVLYLIDGGSETIRTISRGGVVTTFAGMAGENSERIDGVGRHARFKSLRGMTIDSAGNLFVTDNGKFQASCRLSVAFMPLF